MWPLGENFVSAYRVFRRTKGSKPAVLFHGINGKREVPLDTIITAKRRWVQNPGKKGVGRRFISGFHVVPTFEAMGPYLKRFKHPEELVVCRVWVDGFRDKPGSKVKLANSMFVFFSDWNLACGVHSSKYRRH